MPRPIPRWRVRIERHSARAYPFSKRWWNIDEMQNGVWVQFGLCADMQSALRIIAEVEPNRRAAEARDRTLAIEARRYEAMAVHRQRLADVLEGMREATC